MKLYKDNVVLVSGYDGEEDNRFNCFFISNDEQIDDEPITWNVAKLEIDNNTTKGSEILQKLFDLLILK